MFEAVDIYLSVSHIMHENLQADTLDLLSNVILEKVSRPNKLSHNCLSQDSLTVFVFRLSDLSYAKTYIRASESTTERGY